MKQFLQPSKSQPQKFLTTHQTLCPPTSFLSFSLDSCLLSRCDRRSFPATTPLFFPLLRLCPRASAVGRRRRRSLVKSSPTLLRHCEHFFPDKRAENLLLRNHRNPTRRDFGLEVPRPLRELPSCGIVRALFERGSWSSTHPSIHFMRFPALCCSGRYSRKQFSLRHNLSLPLIFHFRWQTSAFPASH